MSVCAFWPVFMSVCFYLRCLCVCVCVCVHCDLSWHSGLGSKWRPLAQKATSRTGIVSVPRVSVHCPSSRVALLLHLHRTYLLSNGHWAPAEQGRRDRSLSRASEPVKPLEQPEQVTNSWVHSAWAHRPRPQPHPPLSPILSLSEMLPPLPIPESISPTFDSRQPRLRLSSGIMGQGSKGQHPGAVCEDTERTALSAPPVVRPRPEGAGAGPPGGHPAYSTKPGGPLPAGQRSQPQACPPSSSREPGEQKGGRGTVTAEGMLQRLQEPEGEASTGRQGYTRGCCGGMAPGWGQCASTGGGT